MEVSLGTVAMESHHSLWLLQDAIHGAFFAPAGRYEWPPDPQEERMTVAGAQRGDKRFGHRAVLKTPRRCYVQLAYHAYLIGNRPTIGPEIMIVSKAGKGT